jgi:hypothetical protein
MASTATTTSNTDNATATIQARGSKLVDVSVYGVNGHTVEAQRSPDGGTTWNIIESYTANTEKVLQSGSIKDYRLQLTTPGTGNVTMKITAGNSL